MEISSSNAGEEYGIYAQMSDVSNQPDKAQRRQLMSKLSKKMARDFAQSKKNSSVFQNRAVTSTQINDQLLREEYVDGRTVVKIQSKAKFSISPIERHKKQEPNERRESMESLDEKDITHNLSMKFE